MFCTYKNVRETFISVSICRRSCIYPACRFLYAGVLGPHTLLCVFSIFRHEGSYARRICKGAFHSPGKSPVLASLVRYFLPFALDKYSVLRWQVFRKKEKNVVLWRGVRFVILLPGFVRMVGDPPRSAGHAISFCHCRQLLFWVFRAYIAIILKF